MTISECKETLENIFQESNIRACSNNITEGYRIHIKHTLVDLLQKYEVSCTTPKDNSIEFNRYIHKCVDNMNITREQYCNIISEDILFIEESKYFLNIIGIAKNYYDMLPN